MQSTVSLAFLFLSLCFLLFKNSLLWVYENIFIKMIKQSLYFRISLYVVFTHFILIFFLDKAILKMTTKQHSKAIQVYTYTYTHSQKMQTSNPKKPIKKISSKKKQKPLSQKKQKKQTQKKSPKRSNNHPKNEETLVKNLKSLKNTLDKIKNQTPNFTPPSQASTPKVSSSDSIYIENLVDTLKFNLNLPEYGSVKVKLTLNRQGQMLKLEILGTSSKSNQTYIEKHIPQIQFPNFGSSFLSQDTQEFLLNLSNDS